MKIWVTMLCAALGITAPVAGALACSGGSPLCTVVDPTGTALNIRSGPDGKIVGTAVKGTTLEFIDHQSVKGKKWARVGRYDPNTDALNAIGGMVFAAYIACDGDMSKATPEKPVVCTVKDPTGSALNVREMPSKIILGSVRNGQRVRVYRTETHDGKLWAATYREAADNPVGWVYDPYLKCAEDAQ